VRDWDKNNYEDQPETHLFIAAVYTNSDSLIRQMLDPITDRSNARVFSSVVVIVPLINKATGSSFCYSLEGYTIGTIGPYCGISQPEVRLR
jgi:hypothetical protein